MQLKFDGRYGPVSIDVTRVSKHFGINRHEFRPTLWCVTHIPSCRCVATVRLRRDAVTLARRLESFKMNWEFVIPPKPRSLARCKAFVENYLHTIDERGKRR